MNNGKKPNIVLILSDQHRFDAISCNGSICKTPAIDWIAQNGMNFTQAYTPTALCSPARGSIMTGLYPHNHGQLANTDNFNGVFDQQILDKQSYPYFLKQQGYVTGIAGKWHLPKGGDCEHWGFDRWHTEGEYFKLLRDKGINFEYGRSNVQPIEWGGDATFCGRSALTAENTEETWITNNVLDMINDFSSGEKPFMVACHYFAPHFPYSVPAPFDTMYNPEDIEQWPNFKDMFINKPTVQQKEMLRWNASHLTWKDWQKAIAAYYGYCTYMDTQIQRIIDRLTEKELVNDTLIIYTADHGDMLGSHRIFNKGMNMYDETHHIPFFAAYPGFIDKGGRCDEFISTVDLMPTLLDIAGAEVPENVDGCSILPLIQGKIPEDWRKDVMCEFHGYEPALCTIRMVRTKKWKYIYNPCSEDELYDLETDPEELYNLAPMLAYKHVLRRMKERMVYWLRKTKDSIVEEDSWKGSPYDLFISKREE